MLFGYALVPYIGILQVVTVTGIYGLSFIATAVNSAFTYALLQRSRTWLAATAAAVVLMWFFPRWVRGLRVISIPVRIVQTNISLNQPWVQPEASALLDELGTLSTSNAGKPRLVVWPETPAPFYLSDDPDFRGQHPGDCAKAEATFLVGYIDMIGEDPSNSAALLSPDGNVVSRYNKMHLVPFGEYIPLKRLLFFAESFTKQVGNFASGTEYTISPVDGHRISTAICYEASSQTLRQFVKQGSELFVLITNDGWFGESSAPSSASSDGCCTRRGEPAVYGAQCKHRNQRHYRSLWQN